MQERKLAIAQGLIADPDKPTSLEDAIEFVGQCTEMCPLFEREEREFKKNVHPLEQVSFTSWPSSNVSFRPCRL
jgi:hypothetical protein